MKFLATKNTYKNEDKDPDFNIYLKDKDNEIIQGEYTKQDGTTGIGWKKFGAIWHNVENGKIKSSKIDIDMKEVLKFEPELKKMAQVYEDYLIQQRNPGYPTPTSQGIDLSKMNEMLGSADKPFEITEEDFDKAIQF